ncbi:hypothetical protein [Paenibacillus harenae]|uniref:hypothetical protein n=1 Tax=Paenibacillus harenae TaxID=306543 RepID=UPI002792A30A|nr:hypothetical protein [Paenibacillus harenae]MDQ0059830.1 hypothetical protein [Paenibacillus harenae]
MLKKWFIPFLRGGRGVKPLNARPALNFDATPDLPLGFGYKMQWYAVRTKDTEGVAAQLMLNDIQPANWSSGVRGAYEGYYFVTPPIDGWTLIANASMPGISANEQPHTYSRLQSLSTVYGAAYYFGTHRIVGYQAWAHAANGSIVRAYGYLGESEETLVDDGEPTADELELGLLDHPSDEQDVLRLAACWTIDPLLENVSAEPSIGIIGVA